MEDANTPQNTEYVPRPDRQSPPKGWRQSLHSIEKPLRDGDFKAAREMADIALTRDIDSPLQTANTLFRQFCIPAHSLAEEWGYGRTSENFYDELPNVYRDSMQLVDILVNSPLTGRYTKGLAAEITVASLINRDLNPVKSDYVALPADVDNDRGLVIDSIRTGFDLSIYSRYEPQPVAVQVKYSRRWTEIKKYSDDILVISLEDLAKNEEDIPRLQKAMYMESLGYTTGWGHRLIGKSSQRLYKKVQTHQDRLADK